MDELSLKDAHGLLLSLSVKNDADITELSKRLCQIVSIASDNRLFVQETKSKTDNQLTKLNNALQKLSALIENMDGSTYRNLNQSLHQGEIPLLDEATSKAGHFRTKSPALRLEILQSLALSTQKKAEEMLERKGQPGKKKNERNHFISAQLANIYFQAIPGRYLKYLQQSHHLPIFSHHLFDNFSLAAIGLGLSSHQHFV
jgi:hypothetical protein